MDNTLTIIITIIVSSIILLYIMRLYKRSVVAVVCGVMLILSTILLAHAGEILIDESITEKITTIDAVDKVIEEVKTDTTSKEQIISIDGSSTTVRTNKGFQKTIYPTQRNIPVGDNYVQFSEYLTIDVTGEGMVFSTVDGNVCKLTPDYTLQDSKTIPKLTYNITKTDTSYYFTMGIDQPINTLKYLVTCDSASYSEGIFYLGKVKIDFNQALTEQGINTTYDDKTSTLAFTPIDGNITKLMLLDPTITYNFNNSQNYILEAYTNDDTQIGSGDIPNNTPQGCIGNTCDDFINITGSPTLDADDNNRYLLTSFTGFYSSYFLFVAQLNITKDSINQLNWSWIGNTNCDDGGNDALFFKWNQTDNTWQNASNLLSLSSSDAQRDIIVGNSYINSTNHTSLIVWLDASNCFGADPTILTDFIKLSVTYDDLIVNYPSNNNLTTGSLSLLLNTSQTRYNHTLIYAFNPVQNFSLCTNSNECQGTVTVPRNASYNFTVWGNDTNNIIKTVTVTNVTIGSSYPNAVSTVRNILANNTNTTASTINLSFNISDDDSWVKNYSLYINGQFNRSLNYFYILGVPRNFTYIPPVSGRYNWSIEVKDSNDIITNSSGLEFVYDVQPANVTILAPSQGEEFSYNTSISLNYTSYDSLVTIAECWYSLDGAANISIPVCANVSLNVTEASHAVRVCSNDTLGSIGCDSRSFTISLGAPAITLEWPGNGSFVNYNTSITLNYTGIDSNGLSDAQLWTNSSGIWQVNQTHNPTSGTTDTFYLNLTEGTYLWNVWVNDTTNSGRFAAQNRTFTIDTTNPRVDNISITLTSGSQTILFNATITDVNLQSCKYTIINASGGVDLGNNNLSFTCGESKQGTVSAFASYTLILTGNDSAGNTGTAQQIFTTVESGTTPPPGGGGGAPPPTVSPVIINQTTIVIEETCGDGYCDYTAGETLASCNVDCRVTIPALFCTGGDACLFKDAQFTFYLIVGVSILLALAMLKTQVKIPKRKQ